MILELILAAAARAAPPAAAPPSDPLTPLYALVGAQVVISLIGTGVIFVRWLASRAVANEDKEKQELKARIDKMEQRFEERLEEQDNANNALEKSVNSLQSDVKQVLSTTGSMHGGITELRLNFEKHIDKQAAHYRDEVKTFIISMEKKVEESEIRLRQDMTRAIADHLRAKRKNI